MFGSKWAHRGLPILLIWIAAPMPLWIMAILMLII
jgi:hypothetical protein